jgi:hypothetical protein
MRTELQLLVMGDFDSVVNPLKIRAAEALAAGFLV